MKAKKPSKRKLIKKLDTVFSLWVRKRYSSGEYAYCYTCGALESVKSIHCGHFMSRKHYTTRWEPDNCRPQCIRCNLFCQGEQYEFGRRLESELGLERVNELRQLRHQSARFSIQDYQDMIERFS